MSPAMVASLCVLTAAVILAAEGRFRLRGPGRRRMGDYATGLEHQLKGAAWTIGALVAANRDLNTRCERQAVELQDVRTDLQAARDVVAELRATAARAAGEEAAAVTVRAPMDRAPYERPTAQLDTRQLRGELRVPGYVASFSGRPTT